MKQLKKTLLTLVALLAVTAGAWADETPLLTIESKDYTTFTSGSETFDDKVTITFSKSVYNEGDYNGWYSGDPSLLTVAGINGYTITSCKFYTEYGNAMTGYTVQGKSPSVYLNSGEVYTDNSESVCLGSPGIKKIEVYGTAPSASSATAVDIAWNGETKTATLTNGMPAGNVTVSVDYYPQATADGAVTAATDAKATTDAPLVTVDATQLTGAAKMMYYASTEATAPDYDAEGWSDKVPTAEKFTEAGNVNVWYYPVGTDEGVGGATATYSDGDMNATALAVTLLPEPTYAVTFADGVNPEPPADPEWTATPNTDVKKGQTVTVTYTGQRKVIGVKAEKYVPRTLAEATAADYGKVVCAAGHLHDAKTAVPTGCTAVGILGKVTETGHGLILALHNATSQTWNTINGWTSVTTYAGTTLKQLPAGALGSLTSYTTLGSTTVSDWCVAQKSDYDAIFQNLDSTQHDQDGYTYDGNVNDYITIGVGGTAISDKYWSATRQDGNWAYDIESEYWNVASVTGSLNVRPVLGF